MKKVLQCACKPFWPILKPKGHMKYCISSLMHCAAVVKNEAFHWGNRELEVSEIHFPHWNMVKIVGKCHCC